jgi:toxin-antitoxin system PIN domain toxin
VILLDANLLLYAYHAKSPQHAPARKWLEESLSGSEPVGLCWQTVLAFVRISTNHRVFERPLAAAEAGAIVSAWLALPVVVMLAPGERYWGILNGLLTSAQVAGPLVTDAALAALAIEHGTTLCTTDRDFSRFPGLKTLNPLEA